MFSFNYSKIRKYSFSIIIHADKRMAAHLVNKILGRHRFQTGDIFTCNKQQFEPMFPYASQRASEATPEKLKDIYQRQSGHMSFAYSAEEQEAMEQLDSDSRVRYMKRHQPLHFLPRRMFTNIPERVFHLVNRYLVIPESYLVLHHWVSAEDRQWYRSAHLKRCVFQMDDHHRTMRILSLADARQVPAAWFLRADYIFIFERDTAALENLFKKCKLRAIFGHVSDFLDVMACFKERQGLVLDMRPITPNLHPDAPFDASRVFWTTDIIRPQNRPAEGKEERKTRSADVQGENII